MLKAVNCFSNGFMSKRLLGSPTALNRQVISAHVSTNTAINRSLRRSQYDAPRSERRRTGLHRRPGEEVVRGRGARKEEQNFRRRMNDLDAPYERKQRPNYQDGSDIENVKESAGINEVHRTQRRLRKPLRRNEKGSFDRSDRGAKYNYESNPEGNRALRRALKFGHRAKPTVLGQSSSATRQAFKLKASHKDKLHFPEEALVENTSSNRTSRNAAAPDYGEEQERRLSMPEELQDSIDAPMAGFSIRQHFNRPDRASHDNRPQGTDYGAPYRPNGRAFGGYGRGYSQADAEQSTQRDANIPLSIPYTTPASEFLYGTSAVTAALLSSRRKLYKLYVYAGDNREDLQQDIKIRQLALNRSVVVERVKEDGLRLMSKMSAGRPHNGYILEASPLPRLPVAGFQAVEKRNGAFHVILTHQSREEAAVNGTNTNIEYRVSFPRYPFVVLLDGILDPGNLGAILRTAFFLGVDSVAISNRNSAPISPVAIKASAGASEALPLLSVGKPANFIDQCKSNGWKIFAAAAPTPGKRTGLGNYLSVSDVGGYIRKQPCLLILGGEGEGLHWSVRKKADFDVGIDGPRIGQSNVDSLNVSVAAGLLCEAFLRKPIKGKRIDVNAPFADIWTASTSDGAMVQEENRVF